MEFNEILGWNETSRYRLLDRMRTDCEYYLGYGNRHPKYLWANNEVEQIAAMKALWNSFGEEGKPEWLSYDKILDYEQQMGIKAILVEMDYKGSYERFALTPEEFEKEFPDTFKAFGPIEESNSDTLKPLVHIWFEPCVVGDDAWERHFTDMEWGLPESDIDAGNLAYIDREQMQSLSQYLEDVSIYHCRAVFEREGVSLEKLAKSELLCQIHSAMPYPDHGVSNMACVEEGPSDGATDMADTRVLIFEFDISMPRDSVSDIHEILSKVDGGELIDHHYARSDKSDKLPDRLENDIPAIIESFAPGQKFLEMDTQKTIELDKQTEHGVWTFKVYDANHTYLYDTSATKERLAKDIAAGYVVAKAEIGKKMSLDEKIQSASEKVEKMDASSDARAKERD